MKNVLKISAFLFVAAMLFQSCGGIAAGMVNRSVINEDSEQYAEVKLAKMKPLQLTTEQEKELRVVFIDEITELKENARKEKSNEISNKGSLNGLRYSWYKAEKRIGDILTKEQEEEYRTNKKYEEAWSFKEMEKQRKKLINMGYSVNF